MSFGSMFVLEDDGYTHVAFIEGKEGLFPHSRIYFRPSTPVTRAEFSDSVRNRKGTVKPSQSNQAYNDVVASHIIKWEVLDKDGNVMKEIADMQGRKHKIPEISGDVLGRTRQVYYDRVIKIVWDGDDPGDPDPFLDDDVEEPLKTPKEKVEAGIKN